MSTFPDQFRLNGRTALVTGSGRGLGWEMAQGLAQAGAKVLLHGRSAERLAPRVAELRGAGFAADAIAFDMADRKAMAGAVAKAGPIDILIHNVGERDRRAFLDIEPEAFARLIDVDLTAAHALVSQLLPGMIERTWGRLILVTSIAGDLAVPNASSYVAAKGGLAALARALALAWFFRHRDQRPHDRLCQRRQAPRALPGQALGRPEGDRGCRDLPRLAGGILRQRPYADRRWRRVCHLPRLMHGFESTHDPLSQGIVAAVLVGVFALLAADRVHRVLIPIGAVALVWLVSYLTPFRLISFEASKEAVDLNVILLLFAMMALVGVLKTTNVFPWAVDPLHERSSGTPSH